MGPTDNDQTQNATAAATPPPTAAPAPAAGSDGSGAPAQPDLSGVPIASKQQQAQANGVPVPVPVRPVRRTGIAGIVDEIRDALAGGQESSHVYQDQQGNKFVGRFPLTHGQQWARIASTALHGAGAGYAQRKPGEALEAGIGAGDKIVQQRKQDVKDEDQQVRQDRLDKYNSIKMKHDLASMEFELTRRNVQATNEDVKNAQGQIDREKELGSSDLGVYKDAASLADVKKQNPDFWKNVYENRIVAVPELSPDGKRMGLHVFLRTENAGNEIVPPGTKVLQFTPPTKPDEKPQLTEREISGPMTHKQLDDANNAATSKYTGWQKDQQDLKDKEAERLLHTEQINTQKTEQTKNLAEATKATQEGRKAKLEAMGGSTGETTEAQAQALLDGRGAPSQLSKRSKDYNAILAKADEMSIKQTGHPYDREAGEVAYHNYQQTLNYYSPAGKGGQNLASFDKFLGHAMDASNFVNELRNTKSPLLNMGFNKMAKLTGSERSPQVVAMLAKAEVVRDEFETMLKNGALDQADIKRAQAIMDENANPWMMQSALKSMAESAAKRMQSDDYSFSRVTKQHIPDIVSPEGIEALKHFGLDPNSVYSKNANQPTTVNAAPANTHIFSKSAWLKANPKGDVNAAVELARHSNYQIAE